MRLHLGPIPEDATFHPEQGPWRRLREPSFGVLMLIASLVGVLVVFAMVRAWGALARLHETTEIALVTLSPVTLLLSLGALGALIAVHEILHALALPGLGRTPATIVGFWPEKITPYVTYEGELSRHRFIGVGLTPFVALSAMPLLMGVIVWMPAWVIILSTINGFASSADLINAVLLLVQTPRSAIVRNKGLETWWWVSK